MKQTEPHPIYLPTVAILLQRGCPDDCLQPAYDWLGGRKVAATIPEVLAQFDEAINAAKAMR